MEQMTIDLGASGQTAKLQLWRWQYRSRARPDRRPQDIEDADRPNLAALRRADATYNDSLDRQEGRVSNRNLGFCGSWNPLCPVPHSLLVFRRWRFAIFNYQHDCGYAYTYAGDCDTSGGKTQRNQILY